LKKFYRFFLDWFEEITTRQADKVLVNSGIKTTSSLYIGLNLLNWSIGFTAEVFKEVFPSIFYKKKPSVSSDRCPINHLTSTLTLLL
jgi:hypothetical protein